MKTFFLLFGLVITTHAILTKVLFGSAGPKCLDGSSAGYYLHKNTDSNKFVIYLHGGGACSNSTDCSQRKLSNMGSSKHWPATMNQGELLSEDPKTNPDFYSWNHIYVLYCSGDLWVGEQTAPMNPFGSGNDTYIFSGHTIIEAIINDARLNMNKSTNVLLTGGSAGGIGAFHHADWLSERLPNSVVKTNPAAGWFGAPFQRFPYFAQNVTDPDPEHKNDSSTSWLKNIKVYSNSAIQACMADPAVEDHSLCGGIPYFYPYTKASIFVSENTADKHQITFQAEMPDDKQLNDTEKAYIVWFGDQLRGNMQKVIVNGRKAKQDGIFAPACFNHGLKWGEKVAGHTWKETLGNWYFGRSGPTQLVETSEDISKYLACK